MKKKQVFFMWMVFIILVTNYQINAQEGTSNSKFSAGADLYTNYLFRGTKFGTGPSVQPNVKYITGGLTIGVWGAFDASGYAETDPYISYTFSSGLTLGLTDYHYPGLSVFETSAASGSHALEINAGFTKKGFSLSGNYVVNEAGGAGSLGNDMYFQAGYSFPNVSLFIGAGDGWHTSDGEFNFCNIGMGITRELILSDKFSIPVSGQVVLNPEREQLLLAVGFSF